ncbi:MAG: hypothetical protein M1835_003676, partial [Candelina submexicana]
MSNLLNNPEGLASMRQRLFEPREELVFSADDMLMYWDYISNVWTSSTRSRLNDQGLQSFWYHCRLRPTTTAKPQGKGERQRTIRKPAPCKASLRVVAHHHRGLDGTFDKPHHWTLQLVDGCESHTHSLTDIDGWKKLKALMDIAGRKVANGYNAATISKAMKGRDRKEEEALLEAGGIAFSRQDVRNADGLEEMGYMTHSLTVPRKSDSEDSRGTVYSTLQRLEVLRLRGHLTLMDSTHETNWMG